MRQRCLLLVLAVALGCTLCACGGLGASPGVPPGESWTTAAGGDPSAAPHPSPTGPPVYKVSAARQALTATLGIQVFWSPDTAASVAVDANRIFNYIVGLGANSVGINFFFFTNGAHPTTVYGLRRRTPSPAIIGEIIADARAHGLRVLVRPLLNEDNIIDANGDWRGSIAPPSVSAWFASYFHFLRPYFVAAQRNGATSFNVGSELDSLAPDQAEWTSFETKAARFFSGQLDYAVNYGRWQEDPPYEPVPDAAVDAYPQLGVGDHATVGRLTAAWVQWLRHQPGSVLQKTVLQEVGIAAAAGTYTEPARVAPAGTPLDIPVQVKWFEAACAAARRTGMAGIYFYDVNGTDQPSDASGYPPGSFIGRGDSAIKACFSSNWP
jgi:hypothetical protein